MYFLESFFLCRSPRSFALLSRCRYVHLLVVFHRFNPTVMMQHAGESSSKAAATAAAAVPTLPLVGSKMRKKMAGQLHEHVSAPTSEFAKKQLEKMGWTAGTGLGKKRDGIVSHIKVQKREENAGLGTERHAAEARSTAESWWKDSLGDTLARLASKNGKKKRKKEYTDEELFEATGGARFGTKGGKLRQAKWRRTETESFDENKADVPQEVNKEHEGIDSEKLFKEETLNEETEEVLSDSEKKMTAKEKKKKEIQKRGKEGEEREEKEIKTDKRGLAAAVVLFLCPFPSKRCRMDGKMAEYPTAVHTCRRERICCFFVREEA